MRRTTVQRLWAVLLTCLALACARTELPPDASDTEHILREATVTLMPLRCAGVVVGAGDRVVTAAHCLDPRETRVPLQLSDGRRVEAEALVVDRARDVAVLGLDAPVTARPLILADALPAPGQPLLFAGRNDRRSGLQSAVVERLGRCPSLPGVPLALFTSLNGQKGDSGAPLVGPDLKVLGLVHGGARCNIATPVTGAADLLAEGEVRWAQRHAPGNTGVGGSGLPPPDAVTVPPNTSALDSR
ncbi:MAG: serine protease [Myxococcaceae bacterium]|nr:serine protease [Myxococcaceae bacterium]MCI0671125.1 serine protease [Myxococcaceae bacterium]